MNFNQRYRTVYSEYYNFSLINVVLILNSIRLPGMPERLRHGRFNKGSRRSVFGIKNKVEYTNSCFFFFFSKEIGILVRC